ncbi:hypothetical protein [Amycolatopsis sp. NPDC059657]|uniref:hypothetical protein n=1 Tax=Amycolatopsis sp. NPDC059657 TaxID=3346899 RepID=UPI0036715B9E
MKKIATIAAVAGAMLVGAIPANATVQAWDCENQGSCFLGSGPFPGGTISIDVDAGRVDGPVGPNETLSWSLQGVPGCRTTFTVDAPPQSWVCRDVPAGSYTLQAIAPGSYRYNWDLGFRW